MAPKIRDIDPSGDPDAAEARVLGPDGTAELVLPDARVLGPNGEGVLDVLRRAAHLTPAECRAMEHEADWRWWSVTPLVGTTIAAAQARAVVIGRNAGRGDAIAALDAAVHRAMAVRDPGHRESRRLVACGTSAGLAILVRDIVDPDTFATLTGPWRAVMHR